MTTDLTVSRYAVWVGRFRIQARLAALTVITVLLTTEPTRPGLHGRHLVVLVTLVPAVVTAASGVTFPQYQPTARVAIEVLGSAVLSGCDPGTSSALLIFAGLDTAESLPPAPAVFFTAVAVVTEAIATVASGNPVSNIPYGLVTLGGFLLGTTLRQSASRAEQAELRLADVQRAEMERTRATHLAERANAAREIHDILAHNLGALIVQLDAVNALMEGGQPDLDGIRPVLRAAHQSAVDGLAEARQAVSSLREDTEPLEVSLAKLTETQPESSLEVTGDRRAVPADVVFTIRRVVQEALTNAAKHAAGSRTAVRVEYRGGALDVTVTDDGRRAGAESIVLAVTGGGYGLAGIRERAELIGAQVKAGPHGSGWRVHLHVPDRVVAR